jgi:hypothetical protein
MTNEWQKLTHFSYPVPGTQQHLVLPWPRWLSGICPWLPTAAGLQGGPGLLGWKPQGASPGFGLISGIYTGNCGPRGQREPSQHETAGAGPVVTWGPPGWHRAAPDTGHLLSQEGGGPGETLAVRGPLTFVTASEGGPQRSSGGLEEPSKGHQHGVRTCAEPALGLLTELSHQCRV